MPRVTHPAVNTMASSLLGGASRPSVARRTWTLALLLLMLVGDADAARKRRKRKAANDASLTPPPEQSEAMRSHQKGVMAHVQGDPKGAIAAFKRATSLKPDFSYAYFRLAFVLEEMRQRSKQTRKEADDDEPLADDEALRAFRTAVALDPVDEMSQYSLGQALQHRDRHDEAASVFEGITGSLNPKSAQAYWALGKVRAKGLDEWDSDPEDPKDPSHCYEHAARLQPAEFQPDGTRIKRVEPMTPEREEREEREAREKRQQVLRDLNDGTRSLNVAGEQTLSAT